MMKYFDLAAKRHSEIIKEAWLAPVIGAAARFAAPVARFAARKPLTTLGTALTAAEIAGGAKNTSQAVMGSKMAPQVSQGFRTF